MEFIKNIELVRKDRKKVSSEDALQGKEVIGLYFSAHWCPPCRMFTPVLADMYNDLSDDEAPFEIIFISSDESEDDLFNYMNETHGNWLAIPFGTEAVSKIKSKFDISGIPTLVILKKDGTLITKDGRTAVQTKGAQAFQEWSQ